MNFGIIGYGRFGKLWANALLPFGEVFIYDKNYQEKVDDQIKKVSIREVSQRNIVFLLIPMNEFAACCQEIKPYLHRDTLIVDCCSVKIYSLKVMQNVFLPTQPLLATHPLFGPDSVKKSGGLAGHKIVVWPLPGDQTKQHFLQTIFEKMGLIIATSTPEEHDKQMANSQGLVHFIGRGITALNLKPQLLATPDFQALLNIQTMVMNDSWQLFLDMQRYNPYVKEIRNRFLQQLISIETIISEEKNEKP